MANPTFLELIRERGGSTPIGQLHAVMDVVEQLIEPEDYQGCIFVNAAMEFPLPHEPAHVAAEHNRQAIESIVHDLAVDADADDPKALAAELCLVMQGAYVTRLLTGDRATIRIARQLADLVIASHCRAAVGAD